MNGYDTAIHAQTVPRVTPVQIWGVLWAKKEEELSLW